MVESKTTNKKLCVSALSLYTSTPRSLLFGWCYVRSKNLQKHLTLRVLVQINVAVYRSARRSCSQGMANAFTRFKASLQVGFWLVSESQNSFGTLWQAVSCTKKGWIYCLEVQEVYTRSRLEALEGWLSLALKI